MLAGSEKLLLRPSIAQLGTTPVGDGMNIQGLFGAQAGTVTVGGQTVPCQWPANDGDPIDHCAIPTDAFGDVLVTVDGIKSPPRKLERWQPTLEYTQSGPGSFLTDIKIHLDFRGDILQFRDAPETAPSDWKAWTAFFADTQKTTCEIALSGSDAGCTESGGLTLPYGPAAPAQCLVFTSLDPTNPAAPIRFQISVQATAGVITCNGTSSPGSATTEAVPGLTDQVGLFDVHAAVEPTTSTILASTIPPVVYGPVTFAIGWADTQPTTPTSDNDAR